MNKIEYLTTKATEEASEVIQRLCKANIFGWDEVQEGQEETNKERFVKEFNDLLASVEMLQEQGIKFRRIADPIEIAKKKSRVEKYMELSRKQGCLTD